jgi:DNA topoisomerase VI subunit B
MSRELAEKLMAAIKKTKIMNPPSDCISPSARIF